MTDSVCNMEKLVQPAQVHPECYMYYRSVCYPERCPIMSSAAFEAVAKHTPDDAANNLLPCVKPFLQSMLAMLRTRIGSLLSRLGIGKESFNWLHFSLKALRSKVSMASGLADQLRAILSSLASGDWKSILLYQVRQAFSEAQQLAMDEERDAQLATSLRLSLSLWHTFLSDCRAISGLEDAADALRVASGLLMSVLQSDGDARREKLRQLPEALADVQNRFLQSASPLQLPEDSQWFELGVRAMRRLCCSLHVLLRTLDSAIQALPVLQHVAESAPKEEDSELPDCKMLMTSLETILQHLDVDLTLLDSMDSAGATAGQTGNIARALAALREDLETAEVVEIKAQLQQLVDDVSGWKSGCPDDSPESTEGSCLWSDFQVLIPFFREYLSATSHIIAEQSTPMESIAWMAQDLAVVAAAIVEKLQNEALQRKLTSLKALLPTEEAFTALAILALCSKQLSSSEDDLAHLQRLLQAMAERAESLRNIMATTVTGSGPGLMQSTLNTVTSAFGSAYSFFTGKAKSKPKSQPEPSADVIESQGNQQKALEVELLGCC